MKIQPHLTGRYFEDMLLKGDYFEYKFLKEGDVIF